MTWTVFELPKDNYRFRSATWN